MTKNWQVILRDLCNTKILLIIVLGFLSGLPITLSASLMQTWFTELGISTKSIGFFSMISIPYSFKYVWAPILDNLSIPVLTKKFGRRKSWLFLIQLCLAVSIIALASSNPLEDPLCTALVACIMAFFAATQDIVIDAYRIEILAKEPEKQGISVAIFIYSYRLGMLLTGAGGLILSQYFSWFEVYTAVAILIASFAVLLAIFAKEPVSIQFAHDFKNSSILEIINKVVVAPFKDFSTKKNWLMILLFTISFKLGDAMLGVMTQNFLLKIGFDKVMIAQIVKIFGFWATLLGTFVGGALIYRLGMIKSLWIGGILQMLTNGFFALQAYVGYSPELLTLTIGAENFASGLGGTAFVAYLSSICSVNFTATQYALLSSLAGVARTFLSAPSGILAENFGWFWFCIITMFAAIPGLIFLYFVGKSFKSQTNKL